MVATKLNLALVGAFVLAVLASLILALATLAGRTGPTDRYHTVYRNVTGLKFGSQVLFEGFAVGQVDKIEPFVDQGRMRFRIEMSIASGWKIPADSVASSQSSGVLAPQTIGITAGNSDTMLDPDSLITPGESAGLMSSISSMSGNFDQLTEQGLVPLIENVNRQVTLLGQMLDKDARPIMHNANIILEAGAKNLPQILDSTSVTTRSMAQLLSPERTRAIDRFLHNADGTLLSLRSSSGEFERLMKTSGPDLVVAIQELRMTMESFSRHSESIAQNMEVTSRNLQEFSRQIRQNPSAVLRSPDRVDAEVIAAQPEKRR
jgi:phospholipid/cholesterol/gamma-HCH transport system substrate-binding protein